uniref:Uncharacterized protein n=1 Tax=Palpitomonas bilix TaxID=652834 RepID=A0A7S3GIV9_9EUKA|mmetsp:Transcript_5563/g.12829  ORF Transcript_5563/g.12829 Transcript_5563/m.12829 type:complete len:367 (+) Transcript_5563:141-1241(+)
MEWILSTFFGVKPSSSTPSEAPKAEREKQEKAEAGEREVGERRGTKVENEGQEEIPKKRAREDDESEDYTPAATPDRSSQRRKVESESVTPNRSSQRRQGEEEGFVGVRERVGETKKGAAALEKPLQGEKPLGGVLSGAPGKEYRRLHRALHFELEEFEGRSKQVKKHKEMLRECYREAKKESKGNVLDQKPPGSLSRRTLVEQWSTFKNIYKREKARQKLERVDIRSRAKWFKKKYYFEACSNFQEILKDGKKYFPDEVATYARSVLLAQVQGEAVPKSIEDAARAKLEGEECPAGTFNQLKSFLKSEKEQEKVKKAKEPFRALLLNFAAAHLSPDYRLAVVERLISTFESSADEYANSDSKELN